MISDFLRRIWMTMRVSFLLLSLLFVVNVTFGSLEFRDLNHSLTTVQQFNLFFNDPFHEENREDIFNFKGDQRIEEAVNFLEDFDNSFEEIIYNLNLNQENIKATFLVFDEYYKAISAVVGERGIQNRAEGEERANESQFINSLLYKNLDPEGDLLEFMESHLQSILQVRENRDDIDLIQLWRNMKNHIIFRGLLKEVGHLRQRESVQTIDLMNAITFFEKHLIEAILPFVPNDHQEATNQSNSCLPIECNETNSCHSRVHNIVRSSDRQTIPYQVFHYERSISLAPGFYCLQNNTKISVNGKLSMHPFSMIKGKVLNEYDLSNLLISAVSYGELSVNLSAPTAANFSPLTPDQDKIILPRGSNGIDGKNRETISYKCNRRRYCAFRIDFLFGSTCVNRETAYDTCTKVIQEYTSGAYGENGKSGLPGGNLFLSINRATSVSGDIFFLSSGGLGGHGGNGGRGKGGLSHGIVGRGGSGGRGGNIRLDLDSLNFLRFKDKLTLIAPGGFKGQSGTFGRQPSAIQGATGSGARGAVGGGSGEASDGQDGSILDVLGYQQNFMNIEDTDSSDGQDGRILDYIDP